MRFILLTYSILLLPILTIAQTIYEIQPHERTAEHADSIYRLYEAGTLEDATYNLEKSIHISEAIDYQNGVVTGYKHLIKTCQTVGDKPVELRNMLLFAKYLEDNQLDQELKQNAYNIGNIYFEYELYEKSKRHYSQALEVNEPSAHLDIELNKRLSLSLEYLQQFDSANVQLGVLEQLAHQQNNWDAVLWSRQQTANIAHTQKQYAKELEISKGIVALTEEQNLEEERTVAINNLAYVFKYMQQPDEAKTYFENALSGKDVLADAVIYQNLAILYQNERELDAANASFNKAYAIYAANKDAYNKAYLADFLALSYYQQSDFHNAIVYNESAIKQAKAGKFGDVLESSYYTQFLIYQGLYEFDKAIASQNSYLHVKDSINRIKQKETAAIELQQYFLDRTEEKVQLHFVNEEVKNLEIKNLETLLAAEAEKSKADSTLNRQMLITQQLKINELQRLREIEQKQAEIERLDLDKKRIEKENAIQEMNLLFEKIKLEQAAEEILNEQQRSKLLDYQVREGKLERKNLLYLLMGLLLIIVIVLLFYLNLRKKKKQITAQKAIIAVEKEKSDSLLLNILPVSVATELKETGKSLPRHFDEISIVFTDFAGFTSISEKLSAVELVETLDKIFLEFDLIVERNGLNRIKTIGDAYMCAAGIPDLDAQHATKAVNTAIEMRDFVETFNKNIPEGEPLWNIRIGVNSGPVVAGVVGIRKFAYDIWGDAVNIASRMESSGQIKKVNISASTYALVKGQFATEHRGKVKAKNKGEIDMYFVERK